MNAVNKIDTTRMTNAAHIGLMEQTIMPKRTLR